MFKSSAALAELVAGGELDGAAVDAQLYAAAESCGLVADDGEAAVRRTMDSGAAAGARNPRTAPPRTGGTNGRAPVDVDEPPIEPSGGVPDEWLDQAPEPEEPPPVDDAPGPDALGFTNFRVEKAGKHKIKIGLSMDLLTNQLRLRVGDWPKAVAGFLFVQGNDGKPLYFEKPTQFFGWLAGEVGKGLIDNAVRWTDHGDNLISRGQFFEYLRHNVEQYLGVEHVPNFPPMPNIFYMHDSIGVGDEKTLNAFLKFFAPASSIDQELLLAFTVSLFWGGDCGKRPAWLFTGPDKDNEGGRGVGKTTTAEKIANVAGGVIGIFDPSQVKGDELEKRLLSPQGRMHRILLIDNLKALKFSWAFLEANITAETISGRQMYVGEGRRANNITTVITANGATLSRDMAQRCNIVKLARPVYSAGDWDADITNFVNANREKLLADVQAFFQRPRGKIETPTRWGPWQNDILSRLENPTAIQEELARRAKECDADDGEKALVEDEIRQAIESFGESPDNVKVKIHAKALAWLVNEALNERMPTNRATAFAKQLQIPELCGQ